MDAVPLSTPYVEKGQLEEPPNAHKQWPDRDQSTDSNVTSEPHHASDLGERQDQQ